MQTNSNSQNVQNSYHLEIFGFDKVFLFIKSIRKDFEINFLQKDSSLVYSFTLPISVPVFVICKQIKQIKCVNGVVSIEICLSEKRVWETATILFACLL